MTVMRRASWSLPLLAAVVFTCALAQELPPLEVYGALPQSSLVALSPDGSKVAARIVIGDIDAVYVEDLETSEFVSGAKAGDVNPRHLVFANADVLLLVAGRTYKDMGVRRAFDYSSAYSLGLTDQKIRVLLKRAKGLYPYQSGLGRIVGRSPDGNIVYMPAFFGSGSKPAYSLVAVRLDRRREIRVENGNGHTIDWFVNNDGEATIREDFDDDDNVHRIWRVGIGKEQNSLLYEESTERRLIIPVGLSHDGNSLVVVANSDETGADSYFLMSMESGALTEQALVRSDADIEAFITDINRVVHGVRYSGFFPSYFFFDEALNERVEKIRNRLPGMSAHLQAWSDDFEKLVFRVAGSWSSGHYLLFDGDDPKPQSVGEERPEITPADVARTYVDSYPARDGLVIPALITAQEAVYEKGNAPLIVMPHGGPESYDVVGFDWMAQYFASRGYNVLQPQFRGSSGFGNEFSRAGYGEWGRKMQTDLDDGVHFLVDAGVADSKRVCMVGASYGGYAALAAGAFSPEMYRCIVSVAGVSDLYVMLQTERRVHGKNDWVVDYWAEQFGAGLAGREFLHSISPAHHADQFAAPVLLLHGKKDTVVLIDQSKRMNRALKKAGKDVTFLQLKGEDHWLTQSETRLATLQAIAEFIEEHL